MKRLPLLLLLFACVSPAAAQQPANRLSTPRIAQRAEADKAAPFGNALSMANVTPEMWLYMQQLQRHDDPELAVRRNAERRAAQRQARMASRKWFGYSNARPTVSPVPAMGTYSAFWAGNDPNPQRWNGVGGPVIRVEQEETIIMR